MNPICLMSSTFNELSFELKSLNRVKIEDKNVQDLLLLNSVRSNFRNLYIKAVVVNESYEGSV